MSRTLRKARGRAEGHSFVMYQRRMLNHPSFFAMSPRGHKALNYLASQYNGHNNGDLSIAWKIAKTKGWASNSGLRAGVKEAEQRGFALQTRQGGRNQCSLFALTWFPIDECGGKLDVPPTRVAPCNWLHLGKLSEPPVVQCAPPVVQSGKAA